jgi:hypothetical protein
MFFFYGMSKNEHFQLLFERFIRCILKDKLLQFD